MGSTFEGIAVHVSIASNMSKSVPVTEKIIKEIEKSKIESIFAGQQSLTVNIRSP